MNLSFLIPLLNQPFMQLPVLLLRLKKSVLVVKNKIILFVHYLGDNLLLIQSQLVDRVVCLHLKLRVLFPNVLKCFKVFTSK